MGLGLLGLFIATPGVAVGWFEGLQDDTAAGAFAWLTMSCGGLLMGIAAWAGLLRRFGPEPRMQRRRRAAVQHSGQRPLAAAELTREALVAAVSLPAFVPARQPARPRRPVTDSRGRLIWWRDRDLLDAFGIPGFAAGIAVAAVVGSGGVLHVLGGAGRGWFFLILAACGAVSLAFDIRLARALARLATRDGHVHSMHWLLLHEPDDGEAYLVLHRVDDDQDETAPMLLRLAKRDHARRLAATGIAEVHGRIEPVTLLIPWIDGSPVWTRHPVNALDLTTEADRARLTYLLGDAGTPGR
ncbi:hypothetical protein AB0M19_19695 [Streptomyces sp. NPDC051920]|uniref:hypothetical protein n=1 Tax=Streptomyces sp. NPDC051920 TaxID=3155523 RepID=UPI0034165EA3